MKFTIKRFRTSRDEVPRPATRGSTGPDGKGAPDTSSTLFEQTDDGFGAGTFATAKAAPPNAARDAGADGPTDLDAIRAEGLTSRQFRLARRVAQKHNLPATSDIDAVRMLRLAGIDPFQRSRLLELVQSNEAQPAAASPAPASTATDPDEQGAPGRVRLPQTFRPMQVPSTEQRAERSHLADLQQIQRDIARRRRRKTALLAGRLFAFVLVPTIAAAIYFYDLATPLYATKSEFVIQQADSAATAGIGGLFRGTTLATSQDSIAVQGYLQSREAMLRLDQDEGFRAHFSDPNIDAIQRLDTDATQEAAYKVYSRNVKIAYDPTEGIIRMEVSATDPESAARFANALISYAEEQVDQLTQRLRGDQMSGALASYNQAEEKMLAAQNAMVDLQQRLKVVNSEVEVGLVTSQIGALETQLTTERLSLEQMRLNEAPNAARMAPIVQRIATLENEIANMRAILTEDSATGVSLAQVQSELLVAEANVQTRQALLAQSLQAMETARIEANRQVRYLSVSVKPIVPDEPAYPRAFENTMVALLLFAGIYLMISMTAEILREQVSA
jgi:capsular polysaccharide transport system permease protein